MDWPIDKVLHGCKAVAAGLLLYDHYAFYEFAGLVNRPVGSVV